MAGWLQEDCADHNKHHHHDAKPQSQAQLEDLQTVEKLLFKRTKFISKVLRHRRYIGFDD
jgi:hypothetical protein